jgi:uncharacterized protein YhfF
MATDPKYTPSSPNITLFMSQASKDLNLPLPAPKDIFAFGGSQTHITARLNAIAFAGHKTATTSYPVPNPIHWGVNDLSVGLDENGEPAFVMRTTYLEEMNFEDVPDSFAVDEGEGTAQEWREGHVEYYNREKNGAFGVGAGKRVLIERFEIIWPLGIKEKAEENKRKKKILEDEVQTGSVSEV